MDGVFSSSGHSSVPFASVPFASVPFASRRLVSRRFAGRQFASRPLVSRRFAGRVLAAALLLPPSLIGGTSSSTAWLWPLPPPRSVTRTFEAPASAYAAGHRGIDLSARPGAPVFAPADGVVSYAGVVAGRPVLSVGHPGDLVSTVEPVLGVVVEGDRVLAGQLVGRVASGGHCASVCLHFGVRLHGQYVSPMLLLGGIPRAVLLPLSSSP